MHANASGRRAWRQGIGLAGPHDMLDHGVTGDAIAHVLGAIETGRIDRYHRYAEALAGGLADGLDVIADQRRHTGVVDEDSRGLESLHRLLDGMKQAFLRAAHDDVLLGQIGGQPTSVKVGTGRAGAAVVPGTARAGDRPVDDVRDIDDRQERDLRAVKGAPAGAGARLGLRATRLGLLVVLARRLVEKFRDVFVGFHVRTQVAEGQPQSCRYDAIQKLIQISRLLVTANVVKSTRSALGS